MGHQVNFHATPQDIGELEAAIRNLEPLVVLHDRSPTVAPRLVPSMEFTEDARRLLFFFVVREADLPAVVTRHVPAQGYWTVDVLRSPVVELNSCWFDGRSLRRGRVFYVDGFFGEAGEWSVKPAEFRTWAKRVLKSTKKTLMKYESDYIGTDALSWLRRESGKLVT